MRPTTGLKLAPKDATHMRRTTGKIIGQTTDGGTNDHTTTAK